jgi:hypothetical protein
MEKETPSRPFLAQGGANLCSVLRGKVALDTQRLAPGLSKRCRGRDYRLKGARFSNEREYKEQWANPMLSTSLILRGQARAQEYRIRVDYDLSRSEDNRPRANPRPARDKLKRASVEPVSGTDKGLSVVGQGIWSMTTILSFLSFFCFSSLFSFLSCLSCLLSSLAVALHAKPIATMVQRTIFLSVFIGGLGA